MWRALGRNFAKHEELVLAFVVLVMAAYEAAEIWLLEAREARSLSVAILFHALQVTAVLIAATLAVRGWRRKTAQEHALTREVERVITAQEEERRRIAYELHDSISPLIISAKQHVDTSCDLLGREPRRAEAELATATERLKLAIVEMRRVLRALRPVALATESLEGAARRSVNEAAREAGWQATFLANLGDEQLPPTVETAAYRILQEALMNVSKHARTERVEVSLARKGEWLLLDVRDHGIGLDIRSAGASRGLGLVSMSERARLLGGSCEIETDGSHGTLVRARLPVSPSSPSTP